MTCYFQHRLFLILCVYISVRACLSLINCSNDIKRSHFLLITPVTRVLGYVLLLQVRLQDGCVFLWPAVKLERCKARGKRSCSCFSFDGYMDGALWVCLSFNKVPNIFMLHLKDNRDTPTDDTMPDGLRKVFFKLVHILWFLKKYGHYSFFSSHKLSLLQLRQRHSNCGIMKRRTSLITPLFLCRTFG